MQWLKAYLLAIITVSVICGVINHFVDKKGAVAPLVRLISGVLITITVVKPVLAIRLPDLQAYINAFSTSSKAISAMGEEYAANERMTIINEKITAYILDKAVALGVDIEVEVTLDDEPPNMPIAIRIHGDAAPYAKSLLMHYILDTLGMGEEAVTWIA